jgi:hypothetical protein
LRVEKPDTLANPLRRNTAPTCFDDASTIAVGHDPGKSRSAPGAATALDVRRIDAGCMHPNQYFAVIDLWYIDAAHTKYVPRGPGLIVIGGKHF